MFTARQAKLPENQQAQPLPAQKTQAVSDHRYERIATAAYDMAETRGFLPGDKLSDWLAAEVEIEGMADVGSLKSQANRSAHPDLRLAGKCPKTSDKRVEQAT